MLKIPTKASITLSIILTILFIGILLGGGIIMPRLVPLLIDLPDNIGGRNHILPFERHVVLGLAYGILLFMGAAGAMLLALLLRVQKGLVFTAQSVGLIRGVSWCAILLGFTFAVLGWYFQLAYFAAFACVFLGVCIRVVKNVIEEATAIKSENDFTI